MGVWDAVEVGAAVEVGTVDGAVETVEAGEREEFRAVVDVGVEVPAEMHPLTRAVRTSTTSSNAVFFMIPPAHRW